MTIIPFPFLSLFFFFLFSFLFFVFFLDLATGRTPCHTLACLITLPALSVARGKKRIAPRAAPGPLPTAASPLPPTPARGTQLLPLPLPSILFHSVSSSCPLRRNCSVSGFRGRLLLGSHFGAPLARLRTSQVFPNPLSRPTLCCSFTSLPSSSF
jgi:hypothetical protein